MHAGVCLRAEEGISVKLQSPRHLASITLGEAKTVAKASFIHVA